MARSLTYIIGTMNVWYEMKLRRLIVVLAVSLCGIFYDVAFSQDSLGIVWKNPRVGMCSARIGDKLYLIGGAAPDTQKMRGEHELESLVGTTMVDVFDFKTDKWDTTAIAPLATPRVYATAVALNDSIYVMGGVDDLGIPLRTMEIYDPTKNEWHRGPNMLLPRKGAASVVYNDSVFVFGGGGIFDILQRTVEVYSPATGKWDSVFALPFGRAFHHVVKRGRFIYIFGGIGSYLGTVLGPLKYVERYDPTGDSAQVALSWGEPRAFFAIVDRNDSVFAISGYGSTDENEYYPDIYLLNFHVLGFEAVTRFSLPLDIERAGFVADTGDGGKVFMFGGYSPEYKDESVPVPTVDIIQPMTTKVNFVRNGSAPPQDFSLSQNYPNPFNPTTKIEFQVPSLGSRVKLEVFNSLGQKVATLVDKFMEGGRYSAVFAGENLPSGAYIYRLQTESGITYRKMVLIK